MPEGFVVFQINQAKLNLFSGINNWLILKWNFYFCNDDLYNDKYFCSEIKCQRFNHH